MIFVDVTGVKWKQQERQVDDDRQNFPKLVFSEDCPFGFLLENVPRSQKDVIVFIGFISLPLSQVCVVDTDA